MMRRHACASGRRQPRQGAWREYDYRHDGGALRRTVWLGFARAAAKYLAEQIQLALRWSAPSRIFRHRRGSRRGPARRRNSASRRATTPSASRLGISTPASGLATTSGVPHTAGGDHRRAAGHRFQQHIGPAFAAGRQHQRIHGVVKRAQARPGSTAPRKRTRSATPRRARQSLQRGFLFAIAGDDQIGVGKPGQGGDHMMMALALDQMPAPSPACGGSSAEFGPRLHRGRRDGKSSRSTPLRSTVTRSGAMPSSTSGVFKASQTVIRPSACFGGAPDHARGARDIAGSD